MGTSQVDGELLTRRQAGALCGFSVRTVTRLRSRKIGFPEPVQVPGLKWKRYRRADVLAWIAATKPTDTAPRG
jgi:predicted DNA-binding transcriptional regulator AlpA